MNKNQKPARKVTFDRSLSARDETSQKDVAHCTSLGCRQGIGDEVDEAVSSRIR